jgi:hypothetical protein
MKIPKDEKKAFELPPQGTQPARLIHILDLGTQVTDYQGKTKEKRQLRLTWELVDAKMQDGRNFVIGKTVSASLYKSNLLEIVESMTGQTIEFESDGSYDMRQLIDLPCMLTVVLTEKDGKKYANIGSVSPMPTIKGKKLEADPATNHLINFGFDAYDQTTFDVIPTWIQEIIKKSPEYAQATQKHGMTATPRVPSIEDSIPF